MLIVGLFGVVFLSVFWGVAAWYFVTMSLNGISFFDVGILNIILYGLFICLPLFVIWWIYGQICQTLYGRKVSSQLQKLFAQMKKNQEYSDLLARIMLGSEQNQKNAFELNRFDLLLADLNELLSDFITRQRLASEDQIEYLWTKVQNGGKWSFGKVIIENFNRQPNFKQKVLVNVLADNVLSGTVLEFCARYQRIVQLLEKYDKEKVFLDMLETGVMGKVFAIMAPIAGEIRRSREGGYVQTQVPVQEREPSAVSDSNYKDSFSMALERSFGKEASLSNSMEKDKDGIRFFDDNEDDLSETQKTINSLKKEWQEKDTASSQKDKIDDLTYPFGGWSDEQNYKN